MPSAPPAGDRVATSPLRAVAHHPTRTAATLWIEARGDVDGWRIDVATELGAPPIWSDDLDGDPTFRLANPHPGRRRRYRVWHRELDGLEPGRRYLVIARKQHRTRPCEIVLATFRTLVPTLPFTVLAASCYSVESDASGPLSSIFGNAAGRVFPFLSQWVSRLVETTIEGNRTGGLSTGRPGLVSYRYAQLRAQLQDRAPDLKLLVGDQVYVDAPVKAFWYRHLSSAWIERHVSHVYHRTWDRLDRFLTGGANVCVSDDHEYWNDFPNRPSPLWLRLRETTAERDMREIGERFRAAMQLSTPLWRFDIGDGGRSELSFMVVDTRMNRTSVYATTEEPGPQFMDDADLETVCSWIADLRAPGVLALGQPLLAPPLKTKFGGRVIADVNLQAYGRQFARLCRAITDSPVDLMVIAGDVHFGRVARVQLMRGGRPGVRLVEVVSSPLALLRGAPGEFVLPAPDELSRFPHAWNPEFDYLAKDTDSGYVEYQEIIPLHRGSASRDAIRKGPEADHFMTVRFDGGDGGRVRATIAAYLVRQPRHEGPPLLAWTRAVELRGADALRDDDHL